jgi:5-methylcytosine-specific restriction endonuclease McrA
MTATATSAPAVSDDPRLHLKAWRLLRDAVLVRDGYRCQIGGSRCTLRATSADHIVARHEGGAFWDPANLRAACRSCNSQRGAQVTNDVRAGRALGTRSRRW